MSNCSVPTSLPNSDKKKYFYKPPEHKDKLVVEIKGRIRVGAGVGLRVGIEKGGELSEVHAAVTLCIYIVINASIIGHQKLIITLAPALLLPSPLHASHQPGMSITNPPKRKRPRDKFHLDRHLNPGALISPEAN